MAVYADYPQFPRADRFELDRRSIGDHIALLVKLSLRTRMELVLEYRRGPKALAHRVTALSCDQPVVVLEPDLGLRCRRA